MADRNIINLPLATSLSGQEFMQVVQPTGLPAPANYLDKKIPTSAFLNFSAGSATQIKNTFYSGPTSGANAAPTFRTLVDADLPTLALLSFASGAVLNWNSGEVTLTHSTNALGLAGGQFSVTRTTPLSNGLTGINTANNAVVRLLNLTGQRGTGAINDEGHVSWNMNLSSTASTEAGRMRIRMLNVTSGAQQAEFAFSVCNNSSAQADTLGIGRTALYPLTTDTMTLGTTALMWSDLFLALGGVLNFNNGDTLLTHAANQLALTGSGSTRFMLGTTSSVTINGTAHAFQLAGGIDATSSASLARYSATTNGPLLTFAKSHNASLGSNTIVQANEELGNIVFAGANGTTYDPAARIQALVDGTPGAAGDMPGRLVFQTTPDGSVTLTEAMRIDNAQRVLIGNGTFGTVAFESGLNPRLQVTGTDASTAAAGVGRFSADVNPPRLVLVKSRNAAIGSHTIVQSGDSVGQIDFLGSNGTGFDLTATIISQVDGTPGAAGDMPGRLVFNTTPDGSATPVERLRIENTGRMVYQTGSALTAGGNTAMALVASSGVLGIYFGSGAPSISAAQGSLYIRSDGASNVTRAYINTNGSTTWTAINTVA